MGAEPQKTEKPAAKSEVQLLREEFEAKLSAAQRELAESRKSEQYWSERSRHVAPADTPDDDDDADEQNHLPVRRDEKPEEFLDEVSKDGSEALKKRGFLTEEALEKKLREERQRNDAKLQQEREHSNYNQRLSSEFPDLVADNQRVTRGEAPQSEHFKMTSKIFREMVADDPKLEHSPATILTAARTAKRLMDAEQKAAQTNRSDRQAERRERIEQQRGERDRGGEIDDSQDDITPLAREVMKNLGVGEGAYRKHAQEDGPSRRKR